MMIMYLRQRLKSIYIALFRKVKIIFKITAQELINAPGFTCSDTFIIVR